MNVPKLRYKDFTEQWKEDKLSNLFSIKSSGDLKKDKLSPTISEEHIYPVYGNALTNDGLLGFYKDFTETAPSITVTGRGEIGKPIFRKNEYNAVGRLLVLHPKNAFIDSYYFTLLISILDIFNETTGVPQLTAPSLGSYPVKFPTYNEQLKIASLFKALDNRIQLQQEKIDLLKEQKKGYMQKIFTQGLRFKNNAGQDFPEWRKSHLHQLVEQVKGNSFKSVENIDIPVLTISAKVGFVNQKDRFSEVIAGNSLAKYTELQKFDLSYNKGNSKTAKYGCVFVQGNYDQALVPNVYKSFRAKPHVNPYFLQYLFSTGLLDKQLKGIISSTARMDGLLNVSDQDFYNLSIHCPSLEEQDKISNFLKLLDQKIEQCENYKKNLEMQKQYFMQQMFI